MTVDEKIDTWLDTYLFQTIISPEIVVAKLNATAESLHALGIVLILRSVVTTSRGCHK